MKLTAIQHEHIARGMRKIYEAANRAYGTYCVSIETDESSFYSKRGLRFNRGKQIN